MASDGRPEVILGAGPLGGSEYPNAPSVKACCDLFHSYSHTRIDHARIYPQGNPGLAEELMQPTKVAKWAVFDTKVTAMGNKQHSKEGLKMSLDASLTPLGVEQVDVFNLHMPASDVSFEETMEAVNEAYETGNFKRRGLSNQSPT